MEVETIEHQLSEVNEENARLKQELSAVRRQLQHVTKISQSLIDARAEMQATAAAGQDSKKTKKTEKAARKKRKKDDAQHSINKNVEEVAGVSVGKSSVAEHVSDLQQLQQQNQAAFAHPSTKADDSSDIVELKVATEDLFQHEIKETAKDTDTNTADQIAAKPIEVAVEVVVKEMVEKVALQADAQSTHQISDSVKVCPQRECQPTEQLQDSQAKSKSTAEKAETQKVEESALSVTDQLKNRLNRLKNASANSSSTRSGATAAPVAASIAAPAAGATEKMQQTQAASEASNGQLKENQPPTPARSSRKRRTTGKVEDVRATVLFQCTGVRLTVHCFLCKFALWYRRRWNDLRR